MALTRNTADNLGGFRQVWIARKKTLEAYFVRNSLSLTKLQLSQLCTELPFKVGDTISARTANQTVHGMFRNAALSIQIDKIRADADAIIERFSGLEVVAICLDHHNTYHLLGQPDYPLTLTSDQDYGGQPAEGQKYMLQLSGLVPLKTPFISIV
jgi:hypothetical protein